MITIPGYTILEQIGKGGMATVFLANQESTQRKVSIKIMDTCITVDPLASDRFQKDNSRTPIKVLTPNDHK